MPHYELPFGLELAPRTDYPTGGQGRGWLRACTEECQPGKVVIRSSVPLLRKAPATGAVGHHLGIRRTSGRSQSEEVRAA